MEKTATDFPRFGRKKPCGFQGLETARAGVPRHPLTATRRHAFPRAFALAAFAAALAAGPAAARVFWTRPGAAHGPTTAGQPGWHRIHRAELEINGGRGELEALGVTLPLAAALEQLRAAYEAMGGEVFVAPGAAFGWGVARVGDRVIRFIAVAPEGPRECVVFRLEQTADDFARSQRASGKPAGEAPGGRERRVVRDLDHRWEARTIETAAPAAEALAAVGRALEAEGWQPALPGAPSAGFYVRDGDVCVVRASDGATPGAPSRVLVLMQRGAREP